MKFRVVFSSIVLACLALPGSPLSAQQFTFHPGAPENDHRVRVREVIRHVHESVGPPIVIIQPNDDPCRSYRSNDDEYRSCDVREFNLPAGPLTVDAGQNGGIRVEGWDRNEIHVTAVINANARSEAEAKQLASEVQVQAGGGKVSATGPTNRDRSWWSVSYRINVPRRTDLDLQASNGGINITGINSRVRFDTTNGGVTLSDLAGDVRGETRNGGLTVNLTGNQWDGAGLDVQTSNGGVKLAIPDGYNADLTTRTVNGGFRSDIPMTVQGEISPRGIQTTLGAGGAPVSVRTTNGGVNITRR